VFLRRLLRAIRMRQMARVLMSLEREAARSRL
jgi:hypothetical protein